MSIDVLGDQHLTRGFHSVQARAVLRAVITRTIPNNACNAHSVQYVAISQRYSHVSDRLLQRSSPSCSSSRHSQSVCVAYPTLTRASQIPSAMVSPTTPSPLTQASSPSLIYSTVTNSPTTTILPAHRARVLHPNRNTLPPLSPLLPNHYLHHRPVLLSSTSTNFAPLMLHDNACWTLHMTHGHCSHHSPTDIS